MSGTRKTKHSEIANRSAEPGSARPLKTLLVGALLVSGCGKTYITNNYYPNPDGGAQITDARQQEDAAPRQDAACVPESAPLVCNDNLSNLATLSPGKSLPFGSYRLLLQGVESHPDLNQAVTIITDSCGGVVQASPDKIKEGRTKYYSIESYVAEVSVSAVGAGEQPDSDWARVSVTVPCYTYSANGQWCVQKSGSLNQGEVASVDNTFRLRQDDINPNMPEPYALVSMLALDGGVLKAPKIYEGESEPLVVDSKFYLTRVPSVNGGFTFGVKSITYEVWKAWPCAQEQADAGTQGDACATNTAPISCSYYYYDGGVGMNNPIDVDGKYLVTLIDFRDGINGKKIPIFTFNDMCGNILKEDLVPLGPTKFISLVPGGTLALTADSITNGLVPLTMQAACTTDGGVFIPYWHAVSEGTIDQGQSLDGGTFDVRLDDIMMENGVPYALLSVLDKSGNTLLKLKIAEGDQDSITVGTDTFKIRTPVVVLGGTFGAKWAEVDIYRYGF